MPKFFRSIRVLRRVDAPAIPVNAPAIPISAPAIPVNAPAIPVAAELSTGATIEER